jgi:hypothetical protein
MTPSSFPRSGASTFPRAIQTIPELLNAVHCYEYQACEHPGWETSEAHAFCKALERRLISKLPGYNDGPWAISRTSIPAAVRKRNELKRLQT